jgi:DNA adenine methylase
VYCDATYTVAHDQNGFVRYNERNFSWSDQERLARAAARAGRRGATVIVSNAHHHEIKKIYRNATFQTLTGQSTLSADPSRRRTVHEYLIVL